MLSQLWLNSAATFRRWGKLEQSIAAIREAEVLDATNPEVWVQVSFIFSPWFSPPTSRPQKTKTQKKKTFLSISLFPPFVPFLFLLPSPPPARTLPRPPLPPNRSHLLLHQSPSLRSPLPPRPSPPSSTLPPHPTQNQPRPRPWDSQLPHPRQRVGLFRSLVLLG